MMSPFGSELLTEHPLGTFVSTPAGPGWPDPNLPNWLRGPLAVTNV